MDKKTFYDVIIEDIYTYDQMLFNLQRMSDEAPNARIRTVANVAIANIKLSMEICKALKNANNE